MADALEQPPVELLAGSEVPLDDSPAPDPALPPTPLDDEVELPLLPALALLELPLKAAPELLWDPPLPPDEELEPLDPVDPPEELAPLPLASVVSSVASISDESPAAASSTVEPADASEVANAMSAQW